MECAGHVTYKIEQRRALLRGMPAVLYATAETIMVLWPLSMNFLKQYLSDCTTILYQAD